MSPIRSWLFVACLLLARVAWSQGTPLGSEFRVNTFTPYVQWIPSVAADPAGNFVVAWTSQGPGYGVAVFGQRYAGSGVPLGTEFRVTSYTMISSLPALATDSSGNFLVLWTGWTDGSDNGVFGQRYVSSGPALGPVFLINTYTTGQQHHQAVAVDPAGNFVVVWESALEDGAGWGVFGQRFANSSVPLGPQFRVTTYTTGDQQQPAIAAGGAGDFVVVWGSSVQDGAGPGVFGQRYASSGLPLGPEFRVNTYTTNFQGDASIASDPSGNFVVVWGSAGQDGASSGVFGQRFASSGAPLGPEFRVNTYTTGPQTDPSVTTDPAGNFVVAWTSQYEDGLVAGVFGQRYASSGVPLGPEFQVNTYTPNDQNYPSVASDSAGNFVVVWTSNTQDGSERGIFGQRYGQIVPAELVQVRIE